MNAPSARTEQASAVRVVGRPAKRFSAAPHVKKLIWKSVHKRLCKGTSPSACYPAPLAAREHKVLLTSGRDPRHQFFPEQRPGEAVDALLRRLMSTEWENYLACPTVPSTPYEEPSGSAATAAMRSHLFQHGNPLQPPP